MKDAACGGTSSILIKDNHYPVQLYCSISADGKIYTENDGSLFVVGN